jgi:hypothetical protein
MKLTNDFKLTILGVGALALMLGLNIRHALNNYGITDGNLHMEILAQSNSSGGGSGSGSGSGSGGSNNNGGTNIYYYEHLSGRPNDCKISVWVDASGKVYADGNEAGANVTLSKKTVDGKKETCPSSGNGCTVYSCHVTTNTGSGT